LQEVYGLYEPYIREHGGIEVKTKDEKGLVRNLKKEAGQKSEVRLK